MEAIFLDFDFLQKKQRKFGGFFCVQKTKNFSTYIPSSNNTTNSKFRKETKILSQKLKNFQENSKFWPIFLEFLKINPPKIDFSYEIQEISEKFGKCLKKFKNLIKFPFFVFCT